MSAASEADGRARLQDPEPRSDADAIHFGTSGWRGVLGEEFTGYSGGAMWEDAKVGMFNLFSFERIAVVTDDDGYGRMIKAFGFLVPGKVQVFELGDFDDALEWIAADDEDDD